MTDSVLLEEWALDDPRKVGARGSTRHPEEGDQSDHLAEVGLSNGPRGAGGRGKELRREAEDERPSRRAGSLQGEEGALQFRDARTNESEST